jgi:hypothetical protein
MIEEGVDTVVDWVLGFVDFCEFLEALKRC